MLNEEDFKRLDFGFLLISFKKGFVSCKIQGATYLRVFTVNLSYLSEWIGNIVSKDTSNTTLPKKFHWTRMSKETAGWVGEHSQATEETQDISGFHHDFAHDHTYLQNDDQTLTTHESPIPGIPEREEK